MVGAAFIIIAGGSPPVRYFINRLFAGGSYYDIFPLRGPSPPTLTRYRGTRKSPGLFAAYYAGRCWRPSSAVLPLP